MKNKTKVARKAGLCGEKDRGGNYPSKLKTYIKLMSNLKCTNEKIYNAQMR